MRLFPVSPVAPLLLAERLPGRGTSEPFPVGVLPPGPPESLLDWEQPPPPPLSSPMGAVQMEAELGPTPRAWSGIAVED